MFETVVPETVGPRSRALLYRALPLSVGIHLLAVASALMATIWTVAFPGQSPRLYASYALIETPPPPPPPPPPPSPRSARRIAPAKQILPLPLVAPTIIPDTIPLVEPLPVEGPTPVFLPPLDDHAEFSATGVEGGELGGTGDGLPEAPPPKIIEVKRDDPLPMRAISQEFPIYPRAALLRNWQDSLVVRYLIGKDGRIKEVSVIRPPEHDDFARATLSTIRHWRFHPYLDANGQAKEVSHELTVEFKIARARR